ncbi:MAG: hypothetical protein CBE24_00310, partial [bacterium TMED264]
MLKYLILIQICISAVFGRSISGTVSDSSNGSPLVGANIMLKGTSHGAATNADGRYSIDKIPDGEYVISASYMGFKSFEKNVSIQNQDNFSINIMMIPEAIKMETYVVTASRRRERVEDAPAAISVISKAE